MEISPPDIADRVRQLEARGAIADLVHRYALNIRKGRLDAFAPLVTEDVEFRIMMSDPAGSAEPVERARHIGREALVAYLCTPGRTVFKVYPMIRNLLIEIDGTVATSTCLMSTRSWPAGAEVFGEYEDSFRCEDQWRFSRRVYTVLKKPASVLAAAVPSSG